MEPDPQPELPAARIDPVAFGIAALLRFHLLIILMAVVGLVAGAFVAVTKPNQYTSVGKLMVRSGIRENLTVESAISGRDSSSMRIQGDREPILNELQVLSSPRLYEMAVEKLGADTLLAPYDPTWGASEDAPWAMRLFHGFQSWWFGSAAEVDLQGFPKEYVAAQMLAQSVQIVPEIGASVINVMHEADSPAKAKRVVDAVLAAAIEMHQEVFSLNWAPVEAEQALIEGEARLAEERLRAFRLENEVYDYESQRQGLIRYLADLERQCDAIDLDVRRRQAERDVLTTILNTVPEKRPIDGQITVNPEYTRLTALIGQLELQILDLEMVRARSGDTAGYSKQRELVDKMLLSAKAALEQNKPTIEPPLIDHPRYERIVNLIDEVEVALDGLNKQRVQLGLATKAMKGRVTEFDALEPKLRELELEASQKRQKSDRFAEGLLNLKAVQRLDQMNLSNVWPLHEGTFEPTKTAPSRGKLLLLGFLGGGFGGMLLALGLAYIDRQVRSRIDLQRAGVAPRLIVTSRAGAGETGDPFAEGAGDSPHLWTLLPVDRRATAGLQIAVVACGGQADASAVAADLAIGLSRHGGDRVVFVSCVPGTTPFEQRGQRPTAPGWLEVLRGELSLAGALQKTPVSGLDYLPAGQPAVEQGHASAEREFMALLDRLRKDYRFVVVQVADLAVAPESHGLLRLSEAALVVARCRSTVRADLERAVLSIAGAGARLMATVLQPERR